MEEEREDDDKSVSPKNLNGREVDVVNRGYRFLVRESIRKKITRSLFV